MTKNTSPENLRKFLESDDPALVQMGLSMAKGSGVPEELLPTILRFYMWDEDKTVRAAAKTVFTKYAPAEIKVKVKNNWQAKYRTRTVTDDEFKEVVRPFLEAFKSQDDFALIALKPLIKALEDETVCYRAIEALGKIDDKRAVEPLIKTLEDKEEYRYRDSAAEVLGNIGDKRAVEPLIKALEDKVDWDVRKNAASALGEIGDKRAVEPLIKALEDSDYDVRGSAAEALGKIGDKRAVEPLIKALEDKNHYVRRYTAIALGKIGDKRAVESLIKALEDEYDSTHHPRTQSFYSHIRQNIIEALVKITENHLKGKEKKNIIKFLKSDDQAMVRMGTSMLEGILKE